MPVATECWRLDINSLSPLAAEILRRTIERAKQSHTCDVILRLNGQDHRIQADWVKYLEECFEDGTGKL